MELDTHTDKDTKQLPVPSLATPIGKRITFIEKLKIISSKISSFKLTFFSIIAIFLIAFLFFFFMSRSYISPTGSLSSNNSTYSPHGSIGKTRPIPYEKRRTSQQLKDAIVKHIPSVHRAKLQDALQDVNIYYTSSTSYKVTCIFKTYEDSHWKFFYSAKLYNSLLKKAIDEAYEELRIHDTRDGLLYEYTLQLGYVPIPDAKGSIGIWTEDSLPSFNAILLTDQQWDSNSYSLNGLGYWSVSGKTKSGKAISFRCNLSNKRQEITVNDQKFDLTKGKIFILTDEFTVIQFNDTLGLRDDYTNLQRLSYIFKANKD